MLGEHPPKFGLYAMWQIGRQTEENQRLRVQANYKFSLFGEQSVQNISRFESEASLGGEIRMVLSIWSVFLVCRLCLISSGIPLNFLEWSIQHEARRLSICDL